MITYNGSTKVLVGYKKSISSTIKLIAKDNGRKIRQIDFFLISDDELLEINKTALQHDYYTDIITFDYSHDNGDLEVEMYISIDRVKENAEKYKELFHVELLRVMFHGVLHCVGYKDKTKKESSMMREQENKYLKIHKEMFHVEQK